MEAHVRPLRQDDIDDVLAISKHIWHGHDYVPGVIDDWLKDPDSYTIGVEVDGNLVGISNLRMIENGKTGWMEGLRVHPDYRGQGYANLLTDGLLEHAISVGVPRLRYTTAVENKASMALAERAGLEEVFRMIVFWADAPDSVDQREDIDIDQVFVDELIEHMDAYTGIMPGPIIIYDWKAKDLTAEVLRELGEERSFWQTMSDKGKALSFGGHRYEESEDAWSCTIYSNDDELAQAHMLHHVRIAKSKGLKTVVIILNKRFQQLVEELSWLEETERFREVALMERKLRQDAE
ncbi:MAG: GNAT family N-acetyltransferase [Candidatus Thorarchaeota archaeon]|nr:GNAT family N-acetyltransferase [Candidatus Thorarchaeota archaeon]